MKQPLLKAEDALQEHQVLIDDEFESNSENDSNHNIISSPGKEKKIKIKIGQEQIFISRMKSPRWSPTFEQHSRLIKILAALFYAITSFLIIVINKIVLTTYKFPSYHLLGLGQMAVSIAILMIGKRLKLISYPSFNRSIPRRIFPLPILYAGNLLFGLGGTKRLSLPMFTVLRRFAILMTMVGEWLVLKKTQEPKIIATVLAMVGGTLIAASNDLAFELQGYALVLSNDVFTAANGVYMKKKLDSKELGKYGLLFYNCVFMFAPMFIWCIWLGEFSKAASFPMLMDVGFLCSYLTSCVMGFGLMFSTVLCTSHNSALTTTIVGCLKNILVTYLGMYIGGDYVFSVTNFIGVNISMMGSLAYSYYTFVKGNNSK